MPATVFYGMLVILCKNLSSRLSVPSRIHATVEKLATSPRFTPLSSMWYRTEPLQGSEPGSSPGRGAIIIIV